MPKIISDHEKEITKEAIYQSVVQLIQKKGLNGVTVDDITCTTRMAKGSFYNYYPSKEQCLYDVIRRCEREVFDRVEHALSESLPKKEMLVKLLKEIYLAKDSLVLYVSPKDIETLLRKLPAQYANWQKEKSESYFERTLQLFELDSKQVRMDVLSHLMDSLHFIASNRERRIGQEEALEISVNTIAEYMAKGIQNEGSSKLS